MLFPGGRTLLDGACNMRTPSRESYPNRGSRRLDSNPKRATLKQNFTPKRVDFLGDLILHNSIEYTRKSYLHLRIRLCRHQNI